MPEKIICAAILYKGKMYYGHRHPSALQVLNDELSWEMARKEIHKERAEMTQGFVTTLGRFVDRKEGQIIHKATVGKSHDKDGYRGDELYSEDLY